MKIHKSLTICLAIIITIGSLGAWAWLGIKIVTNKTKTHRDYQIEISLKGTTIYDGNRKVGFLPCSNSQLDSLIINDNL
jgi:hypothetical protein